jgi:ligand-binding SRPBCC domain-containing protein
MQTENSDANPASSAFRLSFECQLSNPLKEVISGFDEKLFRALSPPFPRVKIRRFDGVKAGDRVDLELDFLLFTWKWSSLITSSTEDPDYMIFIDRGEVLPPFLSFWEHHHIMEKTENGSRIRDEIEFRPGKGWPVALVRLMIRMQMTPRNRIYKVYFKSMF